MKYLLFYLILSVLMTSSCKKNHPIARPVTVEPQTTNTVVPEVKKGNLSGVVSPANGLKSLKATALENSLKNYDIHIDQFSGSYSLKDLPEGKYRLYFSTNEYYAKQDPLEVVVKEGTDTAVPELKLKRKGFSISCDVDGAYQGWQLTAYYSPPFLQIAHYTPGSTMDPFKAELRAYLYILLPDIKEPGTYVCNYTTKNAISYRLYKSLLVNDQSTETAGNAGVVVITKIDKETGRIEGTFSAEFSAGPMVSGSARTISNGVFNLKFNK